MSIPIFFIHQNDSFYLKYTLNQAKYLNPNSNVYLIGSINTKNLSGIDICDINNYRNKEHEFRKVFKQLGFLPFEYEFFCFGRWFVLLEFMEKSKIENTSFFHLDSDVLCFRNLTEAANNFQGFDLTISKGICGHNSYFKDISVLRAFCDFMFEYYTNETKFKNLERIYKEINQGKEKDWISDMTLFGLFIEERKMKAFESTTIIEGTTFDNNMNLSEGYLVKNDTKKVKINKNRAFCYNIAQQVWIQHYTLHFQSIAKNKMHRYYIASPKFILEYIMQEIKYFLYFRVGKHVRIKQFFKKI